MRERWMTAAWLAGVIAAGWALMELAEALMWALFRAGMMM